MFTPTNKQKEFLFAKDKRLNFLSGSVRSGKTYISLLKFVLWVASMPPDCEFIMVGKSIGSLQRNCFNYIYNFVGEKNFVVHKSSKKTTIFGRTVWIEGALDERSEGKIRGMTLAGAYCDEVTLYPESFFVMLLTRLSVKGAKLYATCNPDNPTHYIKEKYIDKKDELDCAVWSFLLTDNTHLPQDYIDNLSKEFSGAFYRRFVLGEWCKADGLIYPVYEDAIATPPDEEALQYVLSIDYGTMNAFSVGLWAKYSKAWWRIKEYYYSGRDEQVQKTDEDYACDLDEFTKDIYTAGKIKTIVDPSAASFITLLRRRGRYHVIPADNAVIDGIRETATCLQTGKIKISPICKNWIKEVRGYSWDESASEDKPIKENDHAMDETRYFVKTLRIVKPNRVLFD